MYDPVTLDQLRALLTVVEEGSFSAAARKLRRVQSAVSTAMANLESQLGLSLWDRSTKVPTLTSEGKALLAAARRVLVEVDGLRRLAASLGGGLEPSVSLCIDALFPLAALIDLCTGFASAFPDVELRVDTQVMSGVSSRVRTGEATLGVVSPAASTAGLEKVALTAIRMVTVVSPRHPLAALRGRIPMRHLAKATQIVLSERRDEGEEGVVDQAVLSTHTWRVSDLHTKHALLRAGLGWGNLPAHVVADDLARGRLVAIRPEAWGSDEHTLHLSAIYRGDTPFGPAHRWVLSQLAVLCARDASVPRTRKSRAAKAGVRRA